MPAMIGELFQNVGPYIWLSLLLLALVASWFLTLLGLPGTWFMVGAAALFAWAMPADSPFQLSWIVVCVMLVLALLGELIEFVAGAYGAGRLGASRRGVMLSIVGSLVGGVAGAMFGLPVPVVGSVLGAILIGGIGAMAGAVLGELWKGRTFSDSLTIGEGAFWGRLWGTILKTGVAAVMVVVGAVGAIF